MISFIVHFRGDTNERLKNFNFVYKYYKQQISDCEFIIVEDSDTASSIKENIEPSDQYIHYQNNDVYRKALCYNIGLKHAMNDIVGFIDIDCIVSKQNIERGIQEAQKNQIVIGYNGCAIYFKYKIKNSISKYCTKYCDLYEYLDKFIDKSHLEVNYEIPDTYLVGNTRAVGGCLIGKKQLFESIGGFNPHFKGWGYEDNEIIIRCRNLRVPVVYINTGSPLLFHLPHDPEPGHDKSDHPYYDHNAQEYKKIAIMDKQSIENYIKTWIV